MSNGCVRGCVVWGLAVLLAAVCPAQAWWDTGHMIAADIAYQKLTPDVRKEVDWLVAVPGDPTANTFITAACWPDDLKREGIHAYDPWHYIDLPITPDHTAAPDAPPTPNVVWALQQCVSALKSPKAPPAEKARMLRFLIHFVGDAHQPLHCVDRFTHDHPTGDQGGNLFLINSGVAHNLHAFWDSAGELYTEDPSRPLSPSGLQQIDTDAGRIVAEFPPSALPQAANLDFQRWVNEGAALARTEVYREIQPGSKPSAAYRERTQRVCRRQLALAGYRLANLLNALLAPHGSGSAGPPSPQAGPG